MAIVTPTPRIGKTTGAIRPRPADSEKLPRNAAFYMAADAPLPVAKARKKVRGKARGFGKQPGLINRA
jgi:hypothetical protein